MASENSSSLPQQAQRISLEGSDSTTNGSAQSYDLTPTAANMENNQPSTSAEDKVTYMTEAHRSLGQIKSNTGQYDSLPTLGGSGDAGSTSTYQLATTSADTPTATVAAAFVPLTTFDRFPDLPTELSNKIWKMAMERGITCLRHESAFRNGVFGWGIYIDPRTRFTNSNNTRFYDQRIQNNILLACKQSYGTAKSIFGDSLGRVRRVHAPSGSSFLYRDTDIILLKGISEKMHLYDEDGSFQMPLHTAHPVRGVPYDAKTIAVEGGNFQYHMVHRLPRFLKNNTVMDTLIILQNTVEDFEKRPNLRGDIIFKEGSLGLHPPAALSAASYMKSVSEFSYIYVKKIESEFAKMKEEGWTGKIPRVEVMKIKLD